MSFKNLTRVVHSIKLMACIDLTVLITVNKMRELRMFKVIMIHSLKPVTAFTIVIH